MRRKNSETFPPSNNNNNGAPDHDTYDAKEKKKDIHNNNRTYEAGATRDRVPLGEEKKSDTPPPQKQPQRPPATKNRETHVSFYDRQQIKNLEYSQTRTSSSSLQRRPSSTTTAPPHYHPYYQNTLRSKRPWILSLPRRSLGRRHIRPASLTHAIISSIVLWTFGRW